MIVMGDLHRSVAGRGSGERFGTAQGLPRLPEPRRTGVRQPDGTSCRAAPGPAGGSPHATALNSHRYVTPAGSPPSCPSASPSTPPLSVVTLRGALRGGRTDSGGEEHVRTASELLGGSFQGGTVAGQGGEVGIVRDDH